MKNLLLICACGLLLSNCGTKKNNQGSTAPNPKVINEVNVDYFKKANAKNKITKVPCILSDGTETNCYQITTNSTPTDHQMGPWCPTNIVDDKSAGGIWLEGGLIYDVDGEFIKNMANFYKDTTWKMYDKSGNIYVTKTQKDCKNAANPNVGEEYKNYCVECLPSYITDVTQTFKIPIKPIMVTEAVSFMGRGGGGPPKGPRPEKGDKPERGQGPGPGGARPEREGGIPSTRGIALNGVEFSAPAPVNNILGAYTLAPFDDAGGHINVHQGYHYHTATGMSYSVEQNDGHAPLIGYAMDGHGIYARLNAAGEEASDLDDCRGHYDKVRGYHYHVDHAGNNNFINCLKGAYAK